MPIFHSFGWKAVFYLLISITLLACSDSSDNSNRDSAPVEPSFTYDAEIVWTEYGIPHITAQDWGSLGYGTAYAYAQENYCLAIQDTTHAIEFDSSYPKEYYRRGTAEFALGRAKAARKDFKTVCKLRPKVRDARARLSECDKFVREAAFAGAIP